MKLLTWLRNVYLYFYYHHLRSNPTDKPFVLRAFIATTLLCMSFYSMTIFIILNELFNFVNDRWREVFFELRTPITPMFLILVLFAALLTYLVCNRKLSIKTIEERLSKAQGFEERKNYKLALIFLITSIGNMVGLVLFMVYFR